MKHPLYMLTRVGLYVILGCLLSSFFYNQAGGVLSRVTRYPISISRMTVSVPSSPISLAHIPYRYPG
jgi:hypothetical protein